MNKKTSIGHLSTEGKRIFKALTDEYEISDVAGLRILRVAIEAFDRAQAARKVVERDGMVQRDRHGQLKAHPAVAIERDARSGFLAGLRALNLDIEPLKGIGRPPGRR